MLSPTQLLIKHGFAKKGTEEALLIEKYKDNLEAMSEKDALKVALQEYSEEAKGVFSHTGYPPPRKRYRLSVETFQNPLEEMYYWALDHLRRDLSVNDIRKITDVFTASVHSSAWGSAAQRLTIQQEKVSNYLAAIGQMVKQLFQIVREVRVIDERLEVYNGVEKSQTKDVTLKSIYNDLVEGGVKNPGSVTGLSQQVRFTILPDLFFNYGFREGDKSIYDGEAAINEIVNSLQFNDQIKHILKRKLFSYVNWKEKSFKEMEARRSFTLKHLRQHWSVIKMYMDWIKPYLRNIKRLSMSEKHHDSPDVISAFESSMIEIEIMGVKQPKGKYHPVVLATFELRTKPTMSFSNEYQRGPLHMGKTTMTLRAYAWTEDQINNYMNLRNDENIELLGLVDGSVQAAMDALGDDLERYLKEAGEETSFKKKAAIEKEEKPKKKKFDIDESAFGPFVSIFKGFAELFGSIVPVGGLFSSGGGPSNHELKFDSADKKEAEKDAEFPIWMVFRNYKKAHRLIAW